MGTIPSRRRMRAGGVGGGIGGGEGVVCGGGGEGGGIGGGEGVVRTSSFWQHTFTLSPHMGPGTSGMQHLSMVAVSAANSCPVGQAHWLEPPGVINSFSLLVGGGGGEGGGIGGGEGEVRTSFWQHTSTLSPHMGPGTSGMQHLVMVAVDGANSCPVGQAHWLEPPGVINSFSLHVGGGGGLGGGGGGLGGGSEGVGGGGSGGDGGGGGGGDGGGDAGGG